MSVSYNGHFKEGEDTVTVFASELDDIFSDFIKDGLDAQPALSRIYKVLYDRTQFGYNVDREKKAGYAYDVICKMIDVLGKDLAELEIFWDVVRSLCYNYDLEIHGTWEKLSLFVEDAVFRFNCSLRSYKGIYVGDDALRKIVASAGDTLKSDNKHPKMLVHIGINQVILRDEHRLLSDKKLLRALEATKEYHGAILLGLRR